MVNRILYISIIVVLVSCNKKTVTAPVNDARYAVTITGKWQLPQFTVPPNVHFTFFAGMIHNQNASLWKPGFNASVGIENVAEVGGINELIQEVDAVIFQKNAISHLAIPPPTATGVLTSNIYCTGDHSYVSFASMIAPSPDWFVGVNSLNLYSNNQWVADTLINLYVYDAGTEDGDVFSMTNPATTPQQPITLLTPAKATVLANGNASLGSIATVRFIKL